MSFLIKKNSTDWSGFYGETSMYVKTGAASWNNVKQGFVKTSGGWKQFYIDIIDHFTRTTTGTLGNSDNGFTWTNLFGSFYSTGSAAQADTLPSLAYVETNKNDAQITAAVTNGTGVAFWVNPDNNSWYAAVAIAQAVDTPYSYSYACGTYQCNPVATYTQSCSTCYDTCYNKFYAGGRSDCPSCSFNGFSGTCTCSYSCNPHPCSCTNVFAGYTYSTCTAYCTASGVTTTINYYLQIIVGTSSGAYTVLSTNTSSAQIAAIQVTTSGNYANIFAYSDAAATSLVTLAGNPNVAIQLWNDPAHTTNTNGILGAKHGIVKSVSPYNQSSQVSSFTAKA